MEKENEIIEIMAAVEHARWASWQKHVHNTCNVNSSGEWVIPHHTRERWEKQINTPYSELSEDDKEKDRAEVRKTLRALDKEGFEVI